MINRKFFFRGVFNASLGVTDFNGKLVVLFKSKTAGVFVIYALASKANYEPGLNYTIVNVSARLSAHISAEPRDITINETSTITITVTMGSTPIPGALVKLSCSGGSLSLDSGLTDSEGRLVALFTSKRPGIFIIYAKASKAGYEPGLNTTKVNVTAHPRPTGNATSTKETGTGETKKEASTGGTTGNATSTEVIGDKVAGVTSSGCKKCSGGSTGRTRVFDDGFSSAEGGRGSETPLFRVRGLPRSPYLRTSPGEIYQAGTWMPYPSNGERYSGEVINTPSLSSEILSIEIIPLVEIGGFLPVIRETSLLVIDNETLWFPSLMSFYLNGTTTKPYTVMYTPEVHDERLLFGAKCPHDPLMLQLPPSITNRTRQLAIEITRGIDGDYQKAIAIRDYLMRNYVYDENYTPAPEGWDPIDWFLFEEKRGVCANFNSAFVVLCRCVGIPARVVRGYLIRTDVADQIVKEMNAHCWAEVKFEGIGWVTFDATGGRRETEQRVTQKRTEVLKKIKTITNILSQPSIAVRGDTIYVSGTVRTIYGANVSGLYVFIYIVKDKSSPGVIIGSGNVTNGIFNITCRIPMNHSIGRFQLVAKTSGNEQYEGSMSDPEIVVVCRSRLLVNWPEKVFIGDSFEVSGTLLEDETELPIQNATISISIEGVNSTSVITGSAGNFSALFAPISRPGNYTIYVSYAGNELRLPYETKGVIQVLNANLEWVTPTAVVRGESWRMWGRVATGSRGVEGAEVFFELDGMKIMSGRTNSSGEFEFNYIVPRNMSVGVHNARVILPEANLTIQKIVTIFAKTKIDVKLPEEIESGKNLLLNISLFDDLNQTVAEKELIITISSKAGTLLLKNYTNKNGFLLVNIAPPMNRSVNTVNVEIVFPGSDYYLYSRASGSVKVVHSPTIQPLILLGIAAVAYFSLTGVILTAKKKQTVRGEAVQMEQEFRLTGVPKVEPANKPEVYLMFPSIKEQLPLLWGVGDPLTVNVVCLGPIPKGSSLEVTVDGRKYVFDECKREQSFVVSFYAKGVSVITAKIVNNNDVISETKAMIKIVDYREEISSMHDILVRILKEYGISLENTLTFREELSRIFNFSGKEISEVMVKFYSILEKVSYSLQPISRGDYEGAYFLLMSIKAAFTSKVNSK
ncbi:MAG: transglutaminase domain-containing protein [Nitrososphaeria archaeon]